MPYDRNGADRSLAADLSAGADSSAWVDYSAIEQSQYIGTVVSPDLLFCKFCVDFKIKK